jgi:superfamily II DNA or RNA helicase
MNVPQMRHVVRDLLNFIGIRMIIIDEVHALLASTYRQQRIGVLATSNRKLPFGHSGNCENYKSLI